MSHAWMVAAALVIATHAGGAGVQPAAAPGSLAVSAVRLPSNPLMTLRTSASLGDNINGPTVVRAPAWLARPLGRYYMYFAHHMGQSIRLA